MKLEDHLVERAKAYDQCWLDGRPEDLRRFLHPDVVFTGPRHQRVAKGITDCVQSYVAFLAEARIHDFRSSDYIVDLVAGVAVLTYAWTIDYEIGDARSREAGQELLVWLRQDDQWLIAWRMQRSEAVSGPG